MIAKGKKGEIGGILHTACVLALQGFDNGRIAAILGKDASDIGKLLRSPRGHELSLQMASQRVEAILDPIRQSLGEYCEDAVATLIELMDSEADSVRRQAAVDILHMSGYKPNSANDGAVEKVPMIMVGEMNIHNGKGQDFQNEASPSLDAVETTFKETQDVRSQNAKNEAPQQFNRTLSIGSRIENDEAESQPGYGFGSSGETRSVEKSNGIGVQIENFTDEARPSSK